MVKPLTFKGDKKVKKRKRAAPADHDDNNPKLDDDDDALTTTKAAKTSGTRDRNEAGAPSSTAVTDHRNTTVQDDEADARDDSWVSADVVSDISGPIMFVLPTEPAAALACDASGAVFAMPVENMVDGIPATAEPHDVRQVWVAGRVAGSENFRFKSHHGRYLSCDKIGLFSATSEAVSPLESFVLTATADTPSTFQVQTLRDTFLTVTAPRTTTTTTTTTTAAKGKAAVPGVRGDATEASFDTTVRIRMQARFKPRIKASKEEKAKEKISRAQLEAAVGRRLDEDEVRRLKRARREGDYHEALLDLKVKNKHDKYG